MANRKSKTLHFTETVASLRVNYIERLENFTPEIEELRKALVYGAPSSEEIKDFYQALHKFAGSGATFGFPDISQTARALETLLENILAASAGNENVQLKQAEILRQLAAFQYACATAIAVEQRH